MHISFYFLHSPFSLSFLFEIVFLLFFWSHCVACETLIPQPGGRTCAPGWQLRVLTLDHGSPSFHYQVALMCVLFMVSPTKLSVLWQRRLFCPWWCLADSIGSVNVCRINEWMRPCVNDWAHIFSKLGGVRPQLSDKAWAGHKGQEAYPLCPLLLCTCTGWPPESWGEWVGIEASFGGSLLEAGAGHQPLRWLLLRSLRHLPWKIPGWGGVGVAAEGSDLYSVQLGDWTQYFKMFPKLPDSDSCCPGEEEALQHSWTVSSQGEYFLLKWSQPWENSLGHLAFGGGGEDCPLLEVLWCFNDTCGPVRTVCATICCFQIWRAHLFFSVLLRAFTVQLYSPFPKEAGTLKVIIWIPCWCFLLFRVFPSGPCSCHRTWCSYGPNQFLTVRDMGGKYLLGWGGKHGVWSQDKSAGRYNLG